MLLYIVASVDVVLMANRDCVEAGIIPNLRGFEHVYWDAETKKMCKSIHP